MGHKIALALVFGMAMLAVDLTASGRADDADKPADLSRLHKGLTQAQVRQFLGPPNHVARQILYRRYLEQWVYDGPNPVRIEFDCVRGNKPQIITVHAPTAGLP